MTNKYGMKLSQLTPEILRAIFLLYEKIVGGRIREDAFSGSAPTMEMQMEYLFEGLNRSNAVDWRFGSDLSEREENAKLVVWEETPIFDPITKSRIDKVIRFSFDPNGMSGPEAEKMKQDFEHAIDNLLLETGSPTIAIELPKMR